jgi:hypothetical protein
MDQIELLEKEGDRSNSQKRYREASNAYASALRLSYEQFRDAQCKVTDQYWSLFRKQLAASYETGGAVPLDRFEEYLQLDPTNRKVSAEYFWLMQCTRA